MPRSSCVLICQQLRSASRISIEGPAGSHIFFSPCLCVRAVLGGGLLDPLSQLVECVFAVGTTDTGNPSQSEHNALEYFIASANNLWTRLCSYAHGIHYNIYTRQNAKTPPRPFSCSPSPSQRVAVYENAISFLISAIAFAGFKPLGQVREQFRIV